MTHMRTRKLRIGAYLVAAVLATVVATTPSTRVAAATSGSTRKASHAHRTMLAAQRKASRTSGPMFPATGYFRVTKKSGRWYLVTPQGAPFYSSGIDSVSPVGDTDAVTGKCLYCQAVAANYPNTAAWVTSTINRLHAWGFNTLGSFSDYSLLGSKMPYTVQLTMNTVSDWFSPSFVTSADHEAATVAAPLANDPNVVGYFTDTEVPWGPPNIPNFPSSSLLATYLALPAGSPGLAVAKRYVGNPLGFVYAAATRYFQVTSAAVRKYDRHHLILGMKSEGQEIPKEVLEAARPYVDVFSLEDYSVQPGEDRALVGVWPYYLYVQPNLRNMEQYVQRPLMLGEYSQLAVAPATPDTHPGTAVYVDYPTQQARTAAYAAFIAPLYENARWMVGDQWFEYYDEPQGGRVGDLENDNFGVVNVQDQPYSDLVNAMSVMHSITADRIISPASICDSWATAPGGVKCTATMANTRYPVTIYSSLSPGTIGTTYSGAVYAGGGRSGNYSFSIVHGSLPPGLRLTGAGSIKGRAKQTGTFTFTVEASNRAGSPPATQAMSLTIAH